MRSPNSNVVGVSQDGLFICSCVKNEAPYLLEWIAYHRLLGVEGFLLFDNESTDGTSELLADLARIGVVERIIWPTVADVSPQLTAFRHAIDLLENRIKFVCNLDPDEFIVPACLSSDGLADFLASIPSDAGAVAVNQRIFGSSGEIHYQPRLVVERFTKASLSNYSENNFFKTIYRTSFVSDVTDPHYVHLKDGRYVDPDGIDLLTGDHPGASLTINHERIAIYHYILKSREEFASKQRRGGGAGASLAERLARYSSDSFFINRDMNTNECDVDAMRELLPQLRAEILELVARCSFGRDMT